MSSSRFRRFSRSPVFRWAAWAFLLSGAVKEIWQAVVYGARGWFLLVIVLLFPVQLILLAWIPAYTWAGVYLRRHGHPDPAQRR